MEVEPAAIDPEPRAEGIGEASSDIIAVPSNATGSLTLSGGWSDMKPIGNDTALLDLFTSY